MFNITVGLVGKSTMKTGILASREIAIGRAPSNDLVLESGSVSRTHCRLMAIEGATIVQDQGSRNGTWLNGRPVAHPAVLKPEDELVIGPYALRVQSLVGRGPDGARTPGVQSHPPPLVVQPPTASWEHTVLPEEPPDVEQRRQALRLLFRNASGSTPLRDEVLRVALGDSDAEVRLTAVLVAARLGAREVLPALEAAALPSLLQEVEDARERGFYERLWQGVIGYLQGRLHPGDTGPLKPLWRLLGGQLEVTDATSLVLHSLTTPLEPVERPGHLPPGVVEQEGRFSLRRSGLPLRWVPPVEHWLGIHPLRRVRSEGFFVAQLPVDRPLVDWMGNPQPTRVGYDRGQVWLGSYTEAGRLCETLARIEGVPLRLPTADEWEMVARGPDGRRYPWGNLPREDWDRCASAWGAEHLVGDVPEWSFEPTTSTRYLQGGVEDRTWVRHVIYPEEDDIAAALRPVLPLR